MSDKVTIYEVGPRDGLQNEQQLIDTADKIKLVNRLSQCGFANIEVTSFVSPKWVPQMADARGVLTGIDRVPGVSYSALTPNLRGLEEAVAAQADEVAIFASASEGFSQKNINCSIAESLERFAPVMQQAKEQQLPVRGYISCVTDCPYDGLTPPENVAQLAEQMLAMGCYEISLGDTIGAATPTTTALMLDAVLKAIPPEQLAGHFHDTQNRALQNIEACLSVGIRTFDTAVGGLGGCPYAPGAKGNVATEAVVMKLEALGFDCGIDLSQLASVSEFAHTLRTSS